MKIYEEWNHLDLVWKEMKEQYQFIIEKCSSNFKLWVSCKTKSFTSSSLSVTKPIATYFQQILHYSAIILNSYLTENYHFSLMSSSNTDNLLLRSGIEGSLLTLMNLLITASALLTLPFESSQGRGSGMMLVAKKKKK